MDKTKNWSMDLREIFSHFWGEKLGLWWRRRGDQLALVQSIVLVQAKRRNQGMELLYEILVRKVWICWLGNPHNSLFAYVWV